MEAIRSAARRIPTLTMPTPQVEAALFQQLFAEESDVVEQEAETTQRNAIPLFSRISATARRRSGVFATALLLATLLGGGGFWIANQSGTNAGNSPIADAGATPAQAIVGAGASAPTSLNTDAEPFTAEEREGITTLSRTEEVGGHKHTTRIKEEAQKPEYQLPDVQKGAPEPVSPPYALNAQDGSLESESWPPSSLNLLADNSGKTVESNGREAQSAPANNPAAASVSPVYAALPHKRDEQTISASYRHGLAYVENDESQFTAQDFSLRVEGRFDNRHRLSLAVGQSPLLVERTARTLSTGIAMDGKGASIAAAERVEHFSRISEEVWAGVGYGYALIAGKQIRVEPGVNVGVGERSLRFSAELPIRYRLSERLSLDLVASVSRVQPHDQITRDVEREYDRTSFLHVDEEQHPVFTTMGASIGVSFDIGQ